jgi:hypothetical protein
LPYPLEVAVWALTAAGHGGIGAIVQWAAKADGAELTRLRVPRDPSIRRCHLPSAARIRRC